MEQEITVACVGMQYQQSGVYNFCTYCERQKKIEDNFSFKANKRIVDKTGYLSVNVVYNDDVVGYVASDDLPKFYDFFEDCEDCVVEVKELKWFDKKEKQIRWMLLKIVRI